MPRRDDIDRRQGGKRDARGKSDGNGRRALLRTALAAAAAGVAATALGERSVSAAIGNMRYGAPNDAGGNTTALASAFGTGVNFTVDTTTGGNGPNVVSVLGEVSAREATGGEITGVAGTTDGGPSVNAIGVYGLGASVSGKGTGVRGVGRGNPAIGVSGEGSDVGVRGASGAGVAVMAETTAGVAAQASATDPAGVGIRAVHSGGGTALRSEGKSEFTGEATFNGKVVASGAGSKFVGDGSGLTGLPAADLSNLNASNLKAGTVPDERLASNVARLDAASALFAGALGARTIGGADGGLPSLAGAGSGAIAKGARKATIRAPLVTPRSAVFVVLLSDPGDVSIRFVKAAAGSFDVALTGPAASRTRVAYLALAQ